jgi:excisionase family DNA binding protein
VLPLLLPLDPGSFKSGGWAADDTALDVGLGIRTIYNYSYGPSKCCGIGKGFYIGSGVTQEKSRGRAVLLTQNEVAERLKIGRSYSYALLRSGAIPTVRLGKLIRVAESDLDDYIERRKRSETA